jgi:hypothetical protein
MSKEEFHPKLGHTPTDPTNPDLFVCDRSYLNHIIRGKSHIFYGKEDELVQEFVDYIYCHLVPESRQEVNGFRLWMVVEFCFFLQRMEGSAYDQKSS